MYQRPSALTKAFNTAFGWLSVAGIGPRKTVVLEVKGRKSGQPRLATVNLVNVDSREYLVAPRGNTEWARNVRAAGEATIKRGGTRAVRLDEVPVEQRAPVIAAYLKENAMTTKGNFGIEPDASIDEFERIAPDHPVFRVFDAP